MGGPTHVAEGPAPAHLLHAASVRNAWLSRAVADAEATDGSSGVWDTAAMCAEAMTVFDTLR